MWVGSVQIIVVHAPLYLCEACLSELSATVWQHGGGGEVSALVDAVSRLPYMLRTTSTPARPQLSQLQLAVLSSIGRGTC